MTSFPQIKNKLRGRRFTKPEAVEVLKTHVLKLPQLPSGTAASKIGLKACKNVLICIGNILKSIRPQKM